MESHQTSDTVSPLAAKRSCVISKWPCKGKDRNPCPFNRWVKHTNFKGVPRCSFCSTSMTMEKYLKGLQRERERHRNKKLYAPPQPDRDKPKQRRAAILDLAKKIIRKPE